jgi:hypothetical protein
LRDRTRRSRRCGSRPWGNAYAAREFEVEAIARQAALVRATISHVLEDESGPTVAYWLVTAATV